MCMCVCPWLHGAGTRWVRADRSGSGSSRGHDRIECLARCSPPARRARRVCVQRGGVTGSACPLRPAPCQCLQVLLPCLLARPRREEVKEWRSKRVGTGQGRDQCNWVQRRRFRRGASRCLALCPGASRVGWGRAGTCMYIHVRVALHETTCRVGEPGHRYSHSNVRPG